jgi:hypothetical protein
MTGKMVYTVLSDFGDIELRQLLKAPNLPDEVGDTVYRTPFEAEEVARYMFDGWKYIFGLQPAMHLVSANVDWEKDTVEDEEAKEEKFDPCSAMEECPFPNVEGRSLKQDVPVHTVVREVLER